MLTRVRHLISILKGESLRASINSEEVRRSSGIKFYWIVTGWVLSEGVGTHGLLWGSNAMGVAEGGGGSGQGRDDTGENCDRECVLDRRYDS